jgi:hypothetical protein
MKQHAATRLDDKVYQRICRVAEYDLVTPSSIIRKCVVRYLPELERHVLGEKLQLPTNGNAHPHPPDVDIQSVQIDEDEG